MVFKKMLGAFGVGGPSVDTVLNPPTTLPGHPLTGQVNLTGGSHDVDIEQITLSLLTRVEVEGGDHEFGAAVEFHRVQVAGTTRLAEGQHTSIPFSVPLPWETPITAVYGQHLHGMTMGVRTEVSIAHAIDKGDLDPVQVHPLPAQQAILDAFAQLGFRFKSADLEHGHIRGSQQTLPFYQEIEFYAAAQYAHACTQVELTFVTSPHQVQVILEVDKRGGLFTGGHDVYHTLHVPHAGFEHTNWAQHIDSWFQQAVLSHTGGHGYAPPQPAYGHGHHGHHGHHEGHHDSHGGHGMGAGAVVAGVGAGLVGGYLASEAIDEIFDDEGGDED
ncbi:sporulation-control protein [Krasilnikovia cinnamomea]|uniref:Sporulation-control protein n=1 Tax=Krasilnikovia cinnamomea TaxID=349313 RepID=A0A4V2G5X9_9ACTN|nr:sporulation protein [Krasilnikovia cinnamomea]RZU46516.1 sporulation-control protein [Krasilnikovia cinnamomea]